MLKLYAVHFSYSPHKKIPPKMVVFIGGDTQNRTEEWEFCRLVPYRLAMSP